MMWVVLANLPNKPGGGESLAYKMKLSGVSEPAEMANALIVNLRLKALKWLVNNKFLEIFPHGFIFHFLRKTIVSTYCPLQ